MYIIFKSDIATTLSYQFLCHFVHRLKNDFFVQSLCIKNHNLCNMTTRNLTSKNKNYLGNTLNKKKQDRINIQRQTLKYLDQNKHMFNSKVIKYDNNTPIIPNVTKPFETIITVVPYDTLEATVNAVKSNLTKVGFLVFANGTNPGGKYKMGAGAQEESICRRTNLVNCMTRMKYPIPEFGCFYVKDLHILRDVEENKYAFLGRKILADCVLATPYQAPTIDREKTKIKLQQILNAFLTNENYNVVLGAFGCGAFGNPVEDIASLFKEVLCSNDYINRFQNVIFAVENKINTHSYKVFSSNFPQ